MADNFYKEAGHKDFDSHLRGIDFNKPVDTVNFSQGDKLYQYSYLDRMTGQPKVGSYYYGSKNVDASKLGFDVDGRKMIEVKLDEPSSFLKSSAANIEDWNGSDKVFLGGDTQLFSPNASYSSVKVIK